MVSQLEDSVSRSEDYRVRWLAMYFCRRNSCCQHPLLAFKKTNHAVNMS